MRTEDFVKTLRSMTAPAAPPSVATPRLVSDDAQFETIASDATATARAIVAAGVKARGGGDTLAPKLSAAAQQIIDAGKRRR